LGHLVARDAVPEPLPAAARGEGAEEQLPRGHAGRVERSIFEQHHPLSRRDDRRALSRRQEIAARAQRLAPPRFFRCGPRKPSSTRSAKRAPMSEALKRPVGEYHWHSQLHMPSRPSVAMPTSGTANSPARTPRAMMSDTTEA